MVSKDQFLFILSLILLIVMGTQVHAQDVFRDDFNVPHDFLTDGVGSSGWDGFFGAEAGQTADAINVNMDREGMLYLESDGGNWDSFNPYGPFVYKIAEGDFKATTYIGDFAGAPGALVLHNDSFLMARVPNIEDAGAGEDFECMHYFPTWVGNMGRSFNNGAETEWGGTGNNFGAALYIQLERVGNDFHYRFSNDGTTWTELNGSPRTREDMAGPLQVGVAQCNYTGGSSYAAFDFVEIEGVAANDKPNNPSPLNGADDVDRDVTLTWSKGINGDVANLYLGQDGDAVANASVSDPMGVLVAQGQAETEYTPEELLEYGQTYYWRAEDVNQTDSQVYGGDLWSFTVEPYAYPVENVTATASHHTPKGGPEKTIDGSGLVNDLHGTAENTMWSTGFLMPGDAVWIQYDFNEPLVLHEMWVWNGNFSYELNLGVGVSDVNILYSVDGDQWEVLDGTHSLNQGTALDDYALNNIVDLQGIEARYLRLDVLGNFGGAAGHLGNYSLSEVRFFSVPLFARDPKPISGSAARELNTELVWRAGRTATSHRIYLDSNEQGVMDNTSLLAEVLPRRHQVDGLEYDRTYYWKVNEVAGDNVYEGPVWNFSTPEYFSVDDMDSYDDKTNLIYDAWIDGYNNTSNGSTVGHLFAPFAEKNIVISGQSMPFSYDNQGGITSEATLSLGGQNWSAGGVKTLVFFVKGESSNGDGQLYVKINSTQVNASAKITSGLWTQVNIDLAASGASLGNVQSFTIGVQGNGAGILYIDSISLYRDVPAAPVAADPGSAGLLLKYSFENNLTDGSGHGYNGTAYSSPMPYEDGVYGKALSFDGIEDYVDVPIATPLTSLTNSTFAVWVNIDPESTANWARAFDFGTDDTNYMFLTPRAGTTAGGAEFEIRSPEGGLDDVNSEKTLSNGWHHLAVVIDGTTLKLFVDGLLRDTDETSTLPQDLGVTTHNTLGQSQFAADDLYEGLLDEFVIYQRALSEGEIRYLAGDR